MAPLTPKRGSDKTAGALSPAPKFVIQGKTYSPEKLSLRNTPFEKLKTKLGEDAHLLDYIPLSEVEMTMSDEFPPLSPYRIRVGSGKVKGCTEDCRIWAFIMEKARTDGSVEIRLYGEDKYGKMHQHSREEMDRSKQWLELYDIGPKDRSAVLIKCCFIMNNVPLPRNLDFSETFLTTVKRICRVYMDRSKSIRGSGEDTTGKAIVPSQPAYRSAMIARKSEPHGPPAQAFSLRSTTVSRILNEQNDQETTQIQKDPSITSAEAPVVDRGLSWEKNTRISEISTSTSAAMYKDKDLAGSHNVTFDAPSKAMQTLPQSVSPAFKANFTDKDTNSAVHHPQFHSESLDRSKQAPSSPTTRETTVSYNQPVVIGTSPSVVRKRTNDASTGTAGYQVMRNRMEEIDDMIERLDIAARENKKTEIKSTLEQLKQKHKAERYEKKTEYDLLVEEYRSHKEAIERQYVEKLQQKRETQEELDRRRKSLSRADLLDYLDERCEKE
ncbi:hypothetical protein EKO04_005198 [Ascochyta lentis]|uniref:Uncharacterized protein n=1 Tax=Ascochyta lentis TaxID=205686 RepID=A0A8H7J5P2_9PLEO|nr:hypothetical protein EKO04_005198 [Ascochyta lentis]